ncbi:hypothetical protein BDN72DRAFT_893213 [Pluteus cervinus]|uniref:Uncharacterized protein n=1 Tax=Pluteus cervinus TaxID=181527 RepID=A0ACD3B9H3_9AGAR|nr:hypothetical protein BDN72DRAFT_893213 [Pluteus cervinus]
MPDPIFSTLPFDILDLITRQLATKDLIYLSHTSRDTQSVVFPLVLARFEAVPRLDASTGSHSLVLTFTKQNVGHFLYAIHTAPPWFYRDYPTISIAYTFYFHPGFGSVLLHLLRLNSIFERVKALKCLSMDFSVCMYRFRPQMFIAFDKALSGVLSLAAKKGCTELEVNLGVPFHYFPRNIPVPWALRSKNIAKSLVHPFLVPWKAKQNSMFKLTKIDTSMSPGFPSDPYGQAKFLAIINSSTTLTSLSLDLNEERRPTLSSIKAPSLQSFALKNESLDGRVFESFLSRHPNIKVLNICGKLSSPPAKRDREDTPRGLSVKLPCLEQLLCSTELLPYLLQNLHCCLPRIIEVTIVRLGSPYRGLNLELDKLRSQLDGISSFGLRTHPGRGIIVRDLQDADLVRKYITRLEFWITPWIDPSRLDQWSIFPNVNCVKFLAAVKTELVTDYIRSNPTRVVSLEELRLRIAQYPRAVKVVMDDVAGWYARTGRT